jgi:hypothetical protein
MNIHAATRQRRRAVGISSGRSSQSVTDSAATWRKVTSLEAVPYEGWVFNFEVEGHHSYIAQGIGVHNCVCFGEPRMMTLFTIDAMSPYHFRWGRMYQPLSPRFGGVR